MANKGFALVNRLTITDSDGNRVAEQLPNGRWHITKLYISLGVEEIAAAIDLLECILYEEEARKYRDAVLLDGNKIDGSETPPQQVAELVPPL